MRRIAALAAVVFVVAAACGSADPDAQRVAASPSPTAKATPEATPDPSAEGTPAASDPGATGAPTSAPTPPATAARTPTPAPTPAQSGGRLASAKVTLTRIAKLSSPIAMAVRGGDDRLYVAEKGGRIRTIRNGSVEDGTVLDLSSEISTGSEQGLLGIAFSPDGQFLYVNFTNKGGDTVVREYSAPGPPGSLRPDTMRQVLTVSQPFSNHNGGHLAFGNDGRLYIGLGDGGSGGDPAGNAQNLSTLLGKMLRIDPRPSGNNAYGIPDDNPFRGRAGARGEIWAYGLRNPWRYSFDKQTGDLWTGDVGQSKWEEVSVAAAGTGGQNYGWDLREGTHRFEGDAPPDHHPPIYEYANDSGNCAVTGGYVYRGSRIPALSGAYVFADYCAGALRAFTVSGGQATGHRFLGPTASNLASFGQDGSGELYVFSLSGDVFRIDPA